MHLTSFCKIILLLGTIYCEISAQRSKIISDYDQTPQDFDLYQKSRLTLEEKCAALCFKQNQNQPNDESSLEITTTINPLTTTLPTLETTTELELSSHQIETSTSSVKSDFETSTASAKPDFETSTASTKPDFETSTASARSDFETSTASTKPDFETSTASAKPDFETSTASVKPDFETSTASAKPDFETSTASVKPDFETSTASARSDFETSTDSAKSDFETSTVSAKSDFETSTASAKPDFETSTASKKPDFETSSASEKSDFETSTASVKPDSEIVDTETPSTTSDSISIETTTTYPEPDMTNDELSVTDFVIEPVVMPSFSRKGKQFDIPEPNHINELSAASTDALIKLIMDLTKKIENLEETQRSLHKNIGDLHKKIENSPQFKEKQEETTTDLVFGDPDNAAEKWKELSQNVDSTEKLQNVTSGIVEEAFDKGAPPTSVMDFVTKLPNPEVQEAAFSTIADKVNASDKIQEELYWKDVTPYCEQAVVYLGPKNPSTLKMYNLQNQIRLNAARPIAQSSQSIQHQEYMPAVSNWLTMVRDIPDSPPHLENNMKRMMLRTYEGNPINLPFAFHFILILPHNQGFYKQVAYKCLTQEMKSNGHYYNPNTHYQHSNAPQQQ